MTILATCGDRAVESFKDPHAPIRTPSAHPPVTPPRSLFLVHGSAVSGKSWNALAAPLREPVVVLAPDRLGQAPGERWAAGQATSFDAEAEHLAAALAAAPGPVHLFGHSYGGAVAMQLALRWPERVARLTLYEPTRFALLLRRRRGASATPAARSWRSAWPPTSAPPPAAKAEAAALFVDYWSGAGTWAAMDAGRRSGSRRR